MFAVLKGAIMIDRLSPETGDRSFAIVTAV